MLPMFLSRAQTYPCPQNALPRPVRYRPNLMHDCESHLDWFSHICRAHGVTVVMTMTSKQLDM